MISNDTRQVVHDALDMLPPSGCDIKLIESASLQSMMTVDTLSDIDTPLHERSDDFDDLQANAVIMHSSGTTGLPKAIRQSHRWTLSYAFNECPETPLTQGSVALTAGVYHVCSPMRF